MGIEKRIDLTMDEASTFSAIGEVMKNFDSLPEGISIGKGVYLGHWRAEVASIERHGTDTEHEFIIGFRMKF